MNVSQTSSLYPNPYLNVDSLFSASIDSNLLTPNAAAALQTTPSTIPDSFSENSGLVSPTLNLLGSFSIEGFGVPTPSSEPPLLEFATPEESFTQTIVPANEVSTVTTNTVATAALIPAPATPAEFFVTQAPVPAIATPAVATTTVARAVLSSDAAAADTESSDVICIEDFPNQPKIAKQRIHKNTLGARLERAQKELFEATAKIAKLKTSQKKLMQANRRLHTELDETGRKDVLLSTIRCGKAHLQHLALNQTPLSRLALGSGNDNLVTLWRVLEVLQTELEQGAEAVDALYQSFNSNPIMSATAAAAAPIPIATATAAAAAPISTFATPAATITQNIPQATQRPIHPNNKRKAVDVLPDSNRLQPTQPTLFHHSSNSSAAAAATQVVQAYPVARAIAPLQVSANANQTTVATLDKTKTMANHLLSAFKELTQKFS